LQKGSLNTNDKTITVGKFISSSSSQKSLDLGKSEVYALILWDFSNAANLTLNALNSTLIVADQKNPNNFRGGSFNYGNVVLPMAACSPSNNPCATFTITLTGTNVTCNGAANGTATASITGGTGPFTYLWNPGGQTTVTATGLGSNTYIVRVTDMGTGQVCFCSISITEPALLLPFELYTDPASCQGVCDGMGVVDQAGGTPGFSYLWNDPLAQANDTATGLCAGSYTVTVTDNNGCSATTVVTITEPVVLTSPGSSTNVNCNGDCDGTATVVVAGGTPAYSYNWNSVLYPNPTGDGTASVTNLCPETYTCTVTDVNGCTSSYTTTITEPAVLSSSTAQTNVTCGGVCDGTATITIAGGTSPFTYTWSAGGPGPTTTPALTNVASGLCAGGYTVTISDANGCTITAAYTITQPAILTATATGTNVTCFNACNGTATVVVGGGTPGFAYNWDGVTTLTPTGDGTANITALCPDTYTVTVTDLNGCTATSTVTITQPTALVANATSNNVSCFGAADGDATSAPSGGTPGYSYVWVGPASNLHPTGEFTNTITNLTSGTYTVTVTDLNGCTATQTVTIVEPSVISLSMVSTNATCGGVCDGTATVTASGGTPNYSYSWTGNPIGNLTNAVTSLCAGGYTVTVTDASGCTNTSAVTITEPASLTVTASATALACNGDCNSTISTVVAGGTPIYTYLWSGSGSGNTPSLTNQCAGVYDVQVTDANGCTGSASVTLTEPTALTITATGTDLTCSGGCDGTVNAVVGGGTPGYTYLWMPGNFATAAVINLCANTYTVTATDLNGCTITSTVTVNNPTAITPNASVVNNISCSGGTNGSATCAPAGGTPGYSYDWDGPVGNPNPTGEFTNTITNLAAGSYTVTITDVNGCTATQAVTITQPAVLTAAITASTNSCNICNGTATVTPSGGTPNYTYFWIPGGQITPTATSLCPGVTYTVNITDQNGCTASTTHLVVQAVALTITTNNTNLTCNGSCNGIITANVVGGTGAITYSWTGVVPNPGNVQTASNLCAGTYTVQATDAVGCFNTATVTFVDPPALTVVMSATNVTCANGTNDGTATATPAGGTGAYTYSWSTLPVQTTPTATGLAAGTYTVTVTDVNLCTTTGSVTITQPIPIDDNENMSLPTCGNPNGIIFVAPTGGAGGYTYLWAGPGGFLGQGTNLITNCSAGIYTLAITDANGCVYNFTYLMSNSNAPTTVMSKTDITCNGLTDGTATVTASAGTPGYTYSWFGPTLASPPPTGDGTITITALAAGTYTVQVTDAMGCVKLDTIAVTEPPVMNTNATVTNESCGGSCDGMIVIAPSGGVPSYTYLWLHDNSTNDTLSNLCAGSYTVVTTDMNGCSITDTIDITSPAVLTLVLDSTNVLCNGACNGTATATVGGGTLAYTYAWSYNGTAQPTLLLPNIINLCPGVWKLCVTDANGCSICDSVNITEPTALTSTTSQTNIDCFGNCNGIAIITGAGGSLPYTYSWNTTPTQTNDTIDSLCVGVYSGVVIDANGCTDTSVVTIISPTQITAVITSTNPLCNGDCNGTATAVASGGTGLTYSYSWNSTPTQPSAFADSLCSGSYQVTITDSLGCSVNQSVTLTDPAILLASPTSTSPTCNNGCNGSVTATPSGGTPGYTYLWNPGGSSSQTVNNLCPNTYTLVVTDANSCTDTQTVVLNNPAAIDAVISTANASCGVANGTATVNPITGTPGYTYVWSPNVSVTNSATNLTAGVYSVTVTDANGCDSMFVFAINNNNAPTGATDTINHVLCYGASTGSAAILTVIGGTPGFTYLWSYPTIGGTANDTVLNVPAGNYFCTITDANGCIYNHPITINENPQMVSNEFITPATCNGICDGAIKVTPAGGNGTYSYNWAPAPGAGQGTDSVTALCAGTYTLTITDGLGCVMTDTFTVGQSNPLTGNITSSLIDCF